jgi:hypothetical protein
MRFPMIIRWSHPNSPRIILLVLSVLLAGQLGFLTFSPAFAVTLVQSWGYWVLWVTVAWFLYCVFRLVARPESWVRMKRGGWILGVFLLGVSGFMHVQEQHGFKVVNDEVLLLATSQRMHEKREAGMAGRAYWIGNSFELMHSTIDKRPLFFPFLVSLIHDVSGYRPENIFYTNMLLTPVLLGLLYLLAARFGGRWAGIFAVLLLCTLPLFVQTIAGGGFEVLNLVMILAVIYLGIMCAERPSGLTLSGLCLATVLLAQVRYESVLFVIPTGLIILISWCRNGVTIPAAMLATPLLMVIYPLQYNIFTVRPGLWQLSDRVSEHGVYSLHYFSDNFARALSYFFSLDHSEPNSPLLAAVGLVSLVFFAMWLVREGVGVCRRDFAVLAYVVGLIGLIAQSVLMLCYFWGSFDDVLTVRLSLPTQLLFVLMGVFILPRLVSMNVARWRFASAGALAYLFCWTMPSVLARAYVHQNFAAETANWMGRFAKSRYPEKRYLVIDPSMPVLWTTHEVASMSFEGLAARYDEFLFHYRWKTFSDVLVVQRLDIVDYEAGRYAANPRYDFGGTVELETLAQRIFRVDYAIRISRVKSIDEECLKEWLARRSTIEVKPLFATVAAPSFSSISKEMGNTPFLQDWFRKLP